MVGTAEQSGKPYTEGKCFVLRTAVAVLAGGRMQASPVMLSYLLKARKKDIYQLPSPAVLLDRQVDRSDHGGHQEDGG